MALVKIFYVSLILCIIFSIVRFPCVLHQCAASKWREDSCVGTSGRTLWGVISPVGCFCKTPAFCVSMLIQFYLHMLFLSYDISNLWCMVVKNCTSNIYCMFILIVKQKLHITITVDTSIRINFNLLIKFHLLTLTLN